MRRSYESTDYKLLTSASENPYAKPDGTVVNVVPTNNYSGITMACNSSKNRNIFSCESVWK